MFILIIFSIYWNIYENFDQNQPIEYNDSHEKLYWIRNYVCIHAFILYIKHTQRNMVNGLLADYDNSSPCEKQWLGKSKLHESSQILMTLVDFSGYFGTNFTKPLLFLFASHWRFMFLMWTFGKMNVELISDWLLRRGFMKNS